MMADGPEPVQVRLTGSPEAVNRAAELLAAAPGITPGPMGTKLRHPHLAQGYLTAVIEMSDPSPAAELSTDQPRDGATHQHS